MDQSLLDLIATEVRMGAGFAPKRADTVFCRGEGMHLFDTAGNRYLDFTSAQGIALLGHAPPAVAQAIAEQASRLISLPSLLHSEIRARFLTRLDQVLPDHLPHAFLCNSGTETIEAALKLVRLTTGRQEIVATTKAFHGRTTGALALTWSPKTKKPFEPLLPQVSHMAYNDEAALEQAVTDRTAGLVLEVIQGEGGVNLGTRSFLRAAQERCRRTGTLLVIDEIQTGFGRTGSWFAFEHYGLEPDILCMAKGLGAGFPMGAVAFSEPVGEHIFMGVHGSTFGGNPLACAAGLAALNAYEEQNLIAQSAHVGAYLLSSLRERLQDVRQIRSIRGQGLMIGIELRTRAAPYMKALLEDHRILVLNAGPRVLRLLPPLIAQPSHADQVVDALQAVFANRTPAGR